MRVGSRARFLDCARNEVGVACADRNKITPFLFSRCPLWGKCPAGAKGVGTIDTPSVPYGDSSPKGGAKKERKRAGEGWKPSPDDVGIVLSLVCCVCSPCSRVGIVFCGSSPCSRGGIFLCARRCAHVGLENYATTVTVYVVAPPSSVTISTWNLTTISFFEKSVACTVIT